MDRDDLDICVTSFATAVRQGLLRSLMGCLGVAAGDLAELVEAPRQNANAGTRTVHVGRALAKMKAGLGLAPTDRLIAAELKRVSVRQGWDAEPYCGLDDALAERIRGTFAASNHRFAKRFGLLSWDEVHQPSRWTKAEYHPQDHGFVDRWRIWLRLLCLKAVLRRRVLRRKLALRRR